MSKCILITGGAGYIGSHANLELAARGYDTVILDNLVYGHRDFVQAGTFIEGDIGDPQCLDTLFAAHDIAAVLHFAAFTYVGESVADPAKYYGNNVQGTLTLLDAMRRAQVDTLIFSSSAAVYGVPHETPITEQHPVAPINPYGQTKHIIEQALADYALAYNSHFVSLRYFNAAGADPQLRVGESHDPESHLIPLAIEAVRDPTKTLSIFGTDYDTPDGTCLRDYIHVTDLAKAHVLALEYLLGGGHNQTFNLGNGQGFSVRQVVDSVSRIAGQPVKVVEAPRRPGDPARLVAATDKIRDVLGWEPGFTDLDDIVRTAWEWHSR